MPKISDIYDYINSIAPYSLQEIYDNSGANVMFGEREIRTILTALDITNEIIDEAKACGAELIVTHHPVIFRPLKSLSDTNTAVKLCTSGISAISAHTNFDSAVMNKLFCETVGMKSVDSLTEENGAPVGCICELEEGMSAKELASLLKDKLGNTVIRYNDTGKALSRIAVCTGSGGSLFGAALAKGCDALITGDVKHDIFIDSHNAGLCVFDAGHFHTENIFCGYMKDKLSEAFPEVTVRVSEQNRDILSYEF